MLNIQVESLKALSQLKLRDGVKKVRISLNDSLSYDLRRFYFFNNEELSKLDIKIGNFGTIELPNGISISKDEFEKRFTVEMESGLRYEAHKWMGKSFHLLYYVFNQEENPAREIDHLVFGQFSDIYFSLRETQKKISNSIQFKEVDDKEQSFIAVSGKDAHSIQNHSLGLYKRNTEFNGFLKDGSLRVIFAEPRSDLLFLLTEKYLKYYKDCDFYDFAEFFHDSSVYDASKSMSSMLSHSIMNVSVSSYSLEDLDFTEQGEIIRYRQGFQILNGAAFMDGIPTKLLDKFGIKYGRCDITGELVTKTNGSNSTFLDSDEVASIGEHINNGVDITISSRFIEDSQLYYECSICGDTHSYISEDAIEKARLALDDRQFEVFKRVVRYRFSVDIEDQEEVEDEYDFVCQNCKREMHSLKDAVREIGGNLTDGGYYSDSETSFHLSNSGIDDYDYEPDFCLTHMPEESDYDLHLGVEIEIDKGGEDHKKASLLTSMIGSDFTYAMHDGSLDYGFEIATMPATLRYHQEVPRYEKAFELAKILEYRSHDTDSCGLHVHMNRRFFGASRSVQNIKAAFMALILERNWEEVIRFSRRNYHSVEEWADKKDLIDDIKDDDNETEIQDKFRYKYSDDKYVALNTQHADTFELRIFKGTLKYNTYIATLQFVSNLANIAKECTSLSKVQQVTFEDIVNYKRYNELDTYLKERNLAQTD